MGSMPLRGSKDTRGAQSQGGPEVRGEKDLGKVYLLWGKGKGELEKQRSSDEPQTRIGQCSGRG